MLALTSLALAALIVSDIARASSAVLPLRRRQPNHDAVSVASAEYGTIFDVEVQFGNQSFLLLFDTGSSDTWVVETGFECINGTDFSQLPQATCLYADTYNRSSTFEKIEDQYFGVQYGTGAATGITGLEEVTLGGITIQKQQVGLVNRAVNQGDGIDSGIVGFGYPAITFAHPGTQVTNGSLLVNRIAYNPLFTNMYEQGLVDPYFSIALERTPYNDSVAPAGYLALGSLPPVSYSTEFAVVPVEITKTIPLYLTNNTEQITYWTLSVAETIYSNANGTNNFTNSTSFQAVVDSGNPMNVLPPEVAMGINSRFVPPAVPLDDTSFSVRCDAKPPSLSFAIGNKTFSHDGRDLIIPLGDGTCVSAIAAVIPVDGVVLHFLGAAFLKNVVAVFDPGNDEMRFAARTNPSNTSMIPTPSVTPGIYTGLSARKSIPSSLVLFGLPAVMSVYVTLLW